jgi:hypothetical protein
VVKRWTYQATTLTTAISLPSSNTVKISPLSDGEGVITFDSAIIQKPPQKIKVFSGGVQQGFFESRFSQTPPDLVVKFQLIDIVAVILWLVLRLHFVYQRQIEG